MFRVTSWIALLNIALLAEHKSTYTIVEVPVLG